MNNNNIIKPQFKKMNQSTEARNQYALKTFNAFFNELINQLSSRKEDYSVLMKLQLLEALSAQGDTSEELISYLRKLTYTKQIAALPDMPLKKMKEIIEIIYSKLCTAIGPVESDQIFGQIVNELEKNPETQYFPFKNFL